MKTIDQLIFVTLCSFYVVGFSQVKFEKEYRISEQLVPSIALDFIKQADLKDAVTCFVEQSQEGKSFEAKMVLTVDGIDLEHTVTGKIEGA